MIRLFVLCPLGGVAYLWAMHWAVAFLMVSWVWAQAVFSLYTAKGKPASYKQLLRKAASADVVFFGELHNSALAHQLQLRLLQDLIALKRGKVLLGLEMFEKDQQGDLAAFHRKAIANGRALAERTRVWPNFITDYAPLLELARQHGVPIYGTNVPRDIARSVSKEGLSVLDGLSGQQRPWVAPLPFPRLDTLPSYREMGAMAQQHGMNPEYFRLAQMLKDATMAHAITEAFQPGHVFLHINGSYHSDYAEGIVAYLRQYWGAKSRRKIVVISTVASDAGYVKEDRKRADFILVVPTSSVQ